MRRNIGAREIGETESGKKKDEKYARGGIERGNQSHIRTYCKGFPKCCSFLLPYNMHIVLKALIESG